VGGDGSRKGKRTTDNKSLGTLGTNTLQASFITLGRIVHKTGARGEPSTGTMYWCLQRYLEKIIIRTTRTFMAANQGQCWVNLSVRLTPDCRTRCTAQRSALRNAHTL
jgi:hypothetical protein